MTKRQRKLGRGGNEIEAVERARGSDVSLFLGDGPRVYLLPPQGVKEVKDT